MNDLHETLKGIKQRFFAFRNGIVADRLRDTTSYEVIFGLMVPQIAEIARDLTPSMPLADALWSDTHVRESRLLASYLFPVPEITMEKALKLASQIRTTEEADMLAFRLLKRLPYASDLLSEMAARTDITPYMKDTLKNHLS